MSTRWTPTPNLAAFLSALLPGLGQLCCRQWGRGLAFLAAATGVDLSLDVTGSFWSLLRTRVLPQSTGQFLAGSLFVAGIALWSVLDARRVAASGRSARHAAR
jgi:hypothetical protein